MKNMICFILIIFIAYASVAQDDNEYRIMANYPNGDTCESVILAVSGLKMRSQPSFSAKTVTIIPFGKKVKYVCMAQEMDNRKVMLDKDSVSGEWIYIFWQGKHGYVFSGYLGRGIFKMDKPFYLLSESGAWCWDDAYISSNYYYYGAFPNADTSALVIKKLQPTFFNRNEGGMGGVSFSFRQKQLSYFAFASKDSFPEGQMKISKSKQTLDYEWNQLADANQKITIPHTDWELKVQIQTLTNDQSSTYEWPRLIIKDKKTGAWHYLFDQNMYFTHVVLDWCGDLDGDGIQDFMLSINSSDSGGMMLFLSKNPGKWQFVKMAGIYFWGDCC